LEHNFVIERFDKRWDLSSANKKGMEEKREGGKRERERKEGKERKRERDIKREESVYLENSAVIEQFDVIDGTSPRQIRLAVARRHPHGETWTPVF